MKKFLILAGIIAFVSCKTEPTPLAITAEPIKVKATAFAAVPINRSEPAKKSMPFKIKKPTIAEAIPLKPINVKDSLYLLKLLGQLEDAPQIFTVPATGISTVTGKGGTIVTINPGDFKTKNGAAILSEITVELKELLDTKSLLKNNAQTLSGNQLLVSGGSYYIGLKCDGNELELKPGKTLAVQFPKLTDDGMELFYGDYSKGQMDWQKSGTAFENQNQEAVLVSDELQGDKVAFANVNGAGNSRGGQNFFMQQDTLKGDPQNIKLTKVEKQVTKTLYEAIELNKLGWINCDRFNNEQKTNLAYKIEQPGTIAYTATFLIFKDINSVVCGQHGRENNMIYQMPVNRKATFIAIAVNDEKMYAQAQDVTIKPGMLVECELKEISETEMAQLFRDYK